MHSDLKKYLVNNDFAAFKQTLIAEPASNINARNNQLETLLHLSARLGKLSFIEFLMAEGANIAIPNNEGNTALHIAIKKGYFNVAELILKSERALPLLLVKNHAGETPLHLAAQLTHERIYDKLLELQPGYHQEQLEGVFNVRRKKIYWMKIRAFFAALLESLCPSASIAELMESFSYISLVIGASTATQLGIHLAFAGIAFLGLGMITFANFKKIAAEKNARTEFESNRLYLTFLRNLEIRAQQLLQEDILNQNQKNELQLIQDAISHNPVPPQKMGNASTPSDYVNRKEKMYTIISAFGSFLCAYSGLLGVIGLGIGLISVFTGVGVGALIASAGVTGVCIALGGSLIFAVGLAAYHYRKLTQDYRTFGEVRMNILEQQEEIYSEKERLQGTDLLQKINKTLEEIPEEQNRNSNEYNFTLFNKPVPRKPKIQPQPMQLCLENVLHFQ